VTGEKWWDSVIGIVAGYGLDDQEFKNPAGPRDPSPKRPEPLWGPHSPIQWVQQPPSRGGGEGSEADGPCGRPNAFI
jgi:hypothetical protein